jgi:hypothetical protein
MPDPATPSPARARAVVSGTPNGPWEFQAVELAAVVAAVGERPFAASMKCFVGVDRLMAFEQMLFFNTKQLKEESVAYTRNLRVLVMMLAGTLCELGDALQELNTALALRGLVDADAWKPLNECRKLWTGDARLRKARNQVAHHLGDRELYDRALAAVVADETVTDRIYHGDGSRRHDGETELGWGLVLVGLDMTADDFVALLKMTQEGHEGLPGLMGQFFLDLLQRCGVEIENRMEAGPT